MPTNLSPRADPDQYTIIPVPLKITKVLIEELVGVGGETGAAMSAEAAAELAEEEEGDDGEWEDLPGTFDLGIGATKAGKNAYPWPLLDLRSA
jgi:hypothetical protein